MIRAFVDAALMFVRKPTVILPAIVVGILNLIILLFVWDDFIAGFLYELLVLGKAPAGGFFELPFRLFLYYPVDIIVGGIAFFIIMVLQFYLILVISEVVKSKDWGVLSAMGKGVKRIGDALALTIFALIAGFLVSAVFYIITGIALMFGVLGLILLLPVSIVYIFFLAYLFLKLFFLPYVMGIKGLKLKPALKEVWSWSKGIKRLIAILIIFLLLTLIGSVITSIGIFIGDFIPDEFLGFIPIYLFILISLTYSIMVPSLYYSSTQ